MLLRHALVPSACFGVLAATPAPCWGRGGAVRLRTGCAGGPPLLPWASSGRPACRLSLAALHAAAPQRSSFARHHHRTQRRGSTHRPAVGPTPCIIVPGVTVCAKQAQRCVRMRNCLPPTATPCPPCPPPVWTRLVNVTLGSAFASPRFAPPATRWIGPRLGLPNGITAPALASALALVLIATHAQTRLALLHP